MDNQTKSKENGLSNGHRPKSHKNNFFASELTAQNEKSETKIDVKNDPRDEENGEAKQDNWGRLFYECTQNTTAHGVRFITEESRFMIRRIIWLVITLGAIIVFLYYLYNRISYYLEYNVNINQAVDYVDNVEFPTVTLCNRNKFKLTSAIDGGYYDKVLDVTRPAIPPESAVCVSDEFFCDNKCIAQSRVCDGFADCADQTDETHSSCTTSGCNRITVTSDFVNTTYDSIINQVFVVEQEVHSISDGERLIYSTISDLGMVYLLYDNQTENWMFSSSISPFSIILSTANSTTANSSTTPEQYTGSWENPDSSDILTLTLACSETTPETQDISLLSVPPTPSITTIQDLYDNSGIVKDEFIQSCFWRGEECDESHLEVVDTDAGRCVQFTPPDMVQQSGPGYGLSITVNIQQYEYTTLDPKTGVQVLLHKSSEPAMMTEKSFSVSPGLSTLVAIEKTELSHLPPPWGVCEEKKLTYYSQYNIPACQLDCLNKRIRRKCGCRDLYMPSPVDLGNSNPNNSYCSLDTYLNCWETESDNSDILENQCTCPTPCEELLLVPGLSFSAIKSDVDSLEGEELQNMLSIQRELIKAREIKHRVSSDKFLETLRYFTTTVQQAAASATRLLTNQETGQSEMELIRSLSSKVNNDCLWFTKGIHELRKSIDVEINDIVDNLYKFLQDVMYSKMGELRYLLEDVYSCWDSNSCGYYSPTCTSSCDPTELDTYRNMVNPWILEMFNLIDFVTASVIPHAITNITTVRDANLDFEYSLTTEYITPLLVYMREDCGIWCTDNNTAVMSLFYDNITAVINDELLTSLNSFRAELDTFRSSHLINGDFLSHTPRSDVIDEANRLASVFNSILHTEAAAVKEPITDVVELLTDLSRLAEPKCNEQLHELYLNYMDEHTRMDAHLNDLRNYIINYGILYLQFEEEYKNYELSLVELHQQSSLPNAVAKIQTLNVQLVDRFEARTLAMEKLEDHINDIYYLFSAQVSSASLPSSSLFWSSFSLTSPVITTTAAVSSDSEGTPIEKPFSFSDPAVTTFWEDGYNSLEDMRQEMESANTAMVEQLNSVEDYLSDFIDGNAISHEFYKDNFLIIDIFFKELTETFVTQQKAYDFETLMGELGGFLGLLIGCSIMTVLELMDLIIYNSVKKCVSVHKKKQEKNRKVADSVQKY